MPTNKTPTINAGCNKPASQPTQDNGIFIYDMPVSIQQLLFTVLDRSKDWEQLADHMGYKETDKQIFRSQPSPSKELFCWWGEQNHTVTELFMVMHKLPQYVAMNYMRDLVDCRYHRLILTAPDDSDEENATKADDKSTDLSRCASAIPQIKYKELTHATNNWNSHNVLGKGGFGTVYWGNWKHFDVAIKVLEYRGTSNSETNKKQRQLSVNELRHLNSYRHDNILQLYGYSVDDNGNSLCLVSQLMQGGTLDRRLRNMERPLNLFDRLNIAGGIARGLLYLHQCDPPLIHGDIKTANILLDQYNQPKICDFGLSREGITNGSMEVSRLFGTRQYLPDEFRKDRKLTPKVDTYSFGVVLLEIATGLIVEDSRRGACALLTEYVRKKIGRLSQDNPHYHWKLFELMDDKLKFDPCTLELGTQMIVLGLGCTQEKAVERPEMLDVFEQLKSVLEKVRILQK